MSFQPELVLREPGSASPTVVRRALLCGGEEVEGPGDGNGSEVVTAAILMSSIAGMIILTDSLVTLAFSSALYSGSGQYFGLPFHYWFGPYIFGPLAKYGRRFGGFDRHQLAAFVIARKALGYGEAPAFDCLPRTRKKETMWDRCVRHYGRSCD